MPVHVLSGDATRLETEKKNSERMMREAFDREESMDVSVSNTDRTNVGRTQSQVVNLE